MPFEAALLRPPTLLRPAMLCALPAPVRAVRAVLAFVATLSARATCSYPQAKSETKAALRWLVGLAIPPQLLLLNVKM